MSRYLLISTLGLLLFYSSESPAGCHAKLSATVGAKFPLAKLRVEEIPPILFLFGMEQAAKEAFQPFEVKRVLRFHETNEVFVLMESIRGPNVHLRQLIVQEELRTAREAVQWTLIEERSGFWPTSKMTRAPYSVSLILLENLDHGLKALLTGPTRTNSSIADYLELKISGEVEVQTGEDPQSTPFRVEELVHQAKKFDLEEVEVLDPAAADASTPKVFVGDELDPDLPSFAGTSPEDFSGLDLKTLNPQQNPEEVLIDHQETLAWSDIPYTEGPNERLPGPRVKFRGRLRQVLKLISHRFADFGILIEGPRLQD